MTAVLARGGVSTTTVTLSDPHHPYAVVKIVSADLEDRAANLNWRLGWRSFDGSGAAMKIVFAGPSLYGAQFDPG